MSPPLPASRTLAAEVTKKVRERGLVVWIDAEKQFTPFVDALAGGELGFSYPVVRFRGSYLELMLALEPYGNGPERDKVLVHLPGLNKDTIKETPALELYKAGVVFEKSLGTLVREAALGVAKPDDVDAFLRADGITLEKADTWLESQRDRPQDRMSLLLDALGLDDVVLGLIAGDARLRRELPAEGDNLLAFLELGLGLPPAFRTYRIGDRELREDAAATLVASFLMAAEFVHDLKEPPTTPELLALTKLGAHAKKCRELAALARQRHPDAYEVLANDFQEHVEQERTSHHAAVLGSIDTFRFEEAAVRAATLSAVIAGQWDLADSYAASRTTDQCFWVRRSEPLQRTWELLRLAARVGKGLATTRHALDKCGSLDEAVERYVAKLASVDRDHRLFEQRAHALIASDLEDYDRLLAARDAVRAGYREWADATSRAFFTLCVTHGALPQRGLRQRALYDDVVQPLVDQGRVAYVLVDALRFEMAQGLVAELERDKFRVKLSARLCELPSITSVGMNALAPVEDKGRLRAAQGSDGAIKGFYAGSFRVAAPADRVRAISQRSGEAVDLELEELQALTLDKLKQRLRGKPRLVVVRSRELDNAGEVGLHLMTFEHTLTLLKSALSLLSQAGVERFVITSDHGFLLQDSTTANVDFGVSKRVPSRRHALLEDPAGMPDTLELRLSALDYDVELDRYLVLRPDTALWKTNEKVAPFVHGGNSLQERVIPVLVLDRMAPRGKTLSKYEVVARAEPAHLGRQRLSVAVRLQTRETAALGFLAPKSISLALRVPGRPDIAITLIDANPPAELSHGQLLVPPNQAEARLEFELEGSADEKVRVEIFHPDGKEDVSPKVVEGFFDVGRDRRIPKPRQGDSNVPPPPPPGADAPAAPPPPPPAWADLIEDEGFRKVFQILERDRVINEVELQDVLGSPRRVRSFSVHYDALVLLLPFEVEVTSVSGMKAYRRKD